MLVEAVEGHHPVEAVTELRLEHPLHRVVDGIFADHPHAVDRTVEIAARLQFDIRSLRYEYPGLTWLEHPIADEEELLGRVSNGELRFTVADSSARS